MSLQVEWFDADYADIRVASRGETVGDYDVSTEAALVLFKTFDSEAAVLEGSREDLKRLLRKALRDLDGTGTS